MADRRSSFFSRLLSTAPPTPRPKPTSQTNSPPSIARTTAPPPTAATRPPQTAARSTTTSTTPPTDDLKPAPSNPLANAPSSRELQLASQPIIARPTDEPGIKIPSRKTTQSPPTSPSRLTAQSRSPPQPSSSAQPLTQPRSNPSSPSRTPLTSQKAPQLRSPSSLASRSPKQISSPSTNGTKPNSPSKESRTPNQEIYNPQVASTLVSKEKNPVQDPEIPTSNKKLGFSTNIESNLKPDESKEVKEIVEETNIEGNEHKKEEARDFPTLKTGSEAQIIEKAEITHKPDEMQIKEQESLNTKEILPTYTKQTIPQRRKKSAIPDAPEQAAPSSGEHVPLHKDIKDNISITANRMAIGDPKSSSNDKHVSIITLAGENRGASMQMGSSTKKKAIHIRRGYKINPEETTDGEGKSKENKPEDIESTEDQPKEAYVNNNAQGINNSIVFNSSVSERDPGVHMVITYVPKEPVESVDRIKSVETQKAEFNMTRADKLTYEPTVRRRCLRGLLLEPSDSDGENPEKPRRHGCFVSSKELEK